MQKPLFESSQDLTNKYFIGRIVDRNDPQSKNRVRVEIKGINDGIETKALPWYAILSITGGGNNSGVNIPSDVSRVMISFPDGDIYNGIVAFVLPQNIAS